MSTIAPTGTLTPQTLSDVAGAMYPQGSTLFRTLQRYRPYICPFEDLIAEVPVGASVLDVGCGGGLFLGLLAALGREPYGVGFDVSSHGIGLATGMAARANARPGKGDLRFIRLDAEAPWPPGQYDVVSMIDVIHHVPPAAQEACIRRASRTVAPGGIFLFKDMVSRPVWRALANRMHDLVLARQWIHYVPVAKVEAWAADEGMVLERSDRIDRLWYGHELRVFRRPA